MKISTLKIALKMVMLKQFAEYVQIVMLKKKKKHNIKELPKHDANCHTFLLFRW